MRTVIEARELSIGWTPREVLIEGASFDVLEGEIFGILGRSAAGKTTLFRELIGLERPLSGTIRYAEMGAPVCDGARPRAGVMFQQGALLGSLTVGGNVALPLERWTNLPRDAIAALVRAKLRLVGLELAELQSPPTLSGGMRKRAAIARALALEPPLVFLDEPSSGLDPITASELDRLIRALRDGLGLTVVIVTHDLASTFAIVDRCILLDRDAQRIVAMGPPRAMLDSDVPEVRAFFRRQIA